ncbi:MAG: glycogen debranching protein [Labilithrix sp.]|nr:glycogen debranching protein [Labilithrix sp.]
MTKEPVIRALRWSGEEQPEPLVMREWIVTNGRGGYASGSVGAVPTRRFHGLLVAAQPSPIGRAMMLNHLFETLRMPDGSCVRLAGYERQSLEVFAAPVLREFRLDQGLPVWTFELGAGPSRVVLEKRLVMMHLQNTVQVSYRVLEGDGPLHLDLRPSVCFRPHEGNVSGANPADYVLQAAGGRYEIKGPDPFPTLRMRICGEHPSFTIDGHEVHDLVYRIEKARGYDYTGTLWSPGFFRAELARGQDVVLVASTEPWEALTALSPTEANDAEQARRERLVTEAAEGARSALGRELTFAADQFLITPTSRVEDEARAHAAGDEVRTVIAGYHWFTDWGRDTMISLEGLTLVTGRHDEAGHILRTFGRYVKDGLIPNMFPEGKSAGLYHTADATLWFFHAVHRYVELTKDRLTLQLLLPKLREIFDKHMQGTRFGIGVDPADGLLRQGEEGYQLTWMDAKVGDWVVTPRRGKAVEINALFYNACRLLAGWLEQEGDVAAAKPVTAAADRVQRSFNERFWYADGGYLYDVLDGPEGTNDPALRPNQVFAIALDHPVLDRARWAPVLEVVERELLTPVGLRSLGRNHPDYKAAYDGDLRARDAAYHQGTVWSWLIGPFVDAWMAQNPGREAEAARFLDGFGPHLGEAGVGSVSEVFDAEPPFAPRGCIAQAWGVAEVLRCLVKTGTPSAR